MKETGKTMTRGRWRIRLAALMCAVCLLLTGCRAQNTPADEPETKYISASFYPVYVLAANILKEIPELSLSCLVQPQDSCIRSYSLSDWDWSILQGQDAVILGGGGLESFSSYLEQLPNQPILIYALEGITLREETAGDADDENTAHFVGENPWAFMSVAGAMEMSAAVAAGMAEVDAAFAEQYHENLTAYLGRLDALIGEMSDILAPAPYAKIALLHEGLSYFVGQFSLNTVLTYPREAGADLIDNDFDNLLSALKTAGAEAVFVEEQAPERFVNALEEAGYPVARIDTLTGHMADGDLYAYERIMLENAHAAREALSRTRQTEGK